MSKKYKIVEVYWEDTANTAGWWSLTSGFKPIKDTIMVHPAVGYLVLDAKDHIVLSFCPEEPHPNKSWLGRLTIPKANIRQIKVLKYYEQEKTT